MLLPLPGIHSSRILLVGFSFPFFNLPSLVLYPLLSHMLLYYSFHNTYHFQNFSSFLSLPADCLYIKL